jgi:hypothetical protein
MTEITEGLQVEYHMGMEGAAPTAATVACVWPNGQVDLEVPGAEGDEPQILHRLSLGDESTDCPHFRLIG